MLPVDRGPQSPRPGVGRHHQGGRWPRRPWPPVPPWSTTCRPRCGRWRPAAGWAGWPCTGRGRRPPCRTTPATTTSWPRCAICWPSGPRRAAAAGVDGGLDRPGHRLREDRRPQPRAAGRPGRPGGHRSPGPGRAPAARRFLGVLAAGPDGVPAPVDRPAARLAGHGHVGPPAGGGYGPGPRRGRHRAGRAPGRPPAGASPEHASDRCRIRRSDREGQVGGGHPAAELHLGDQGSPGHERAARRLRPQPPQGAPPGGDHLAPGPGVQPGGVAAPVVAQPAGLRGEVAGQRALPAARLRRRARRAGRGLPGRPRPAGGRRADPGPPGGARRPGVRRHRRVPAVVATGCRAGPQADHRAGAPDRAPDGPVGPRAGRRSPASWPRSPRPGDSGSPRPA